MTTDLGDGRGWAADDMAASIFRIDAALGHPLQITQAGRTVAENNAMIARWDAGNRAGLTTRPSTTSHHLTGEAIDTNFQAWMTANGPAFGFFHDVAGDSVHYDYYASRDPKIGGSSGGNSGGGVVYTAASIVNRLPLNYRQMWQHELGVTEDGAFGPASTRALQTRLGITADGVFGPATLRAVQAFTGAVVDGVWGNGTSASIRATIDAGSFATPTPPVVAPPVATPPPVEAEPPVVTPPVVTPPTTPIKPPAPEVPPVTKPRPTTKAELDAAVEALKDAGVNASAGLPGGVLAGLFTGHVAARRRAYFGYATAALLVSFGPDIALAGFLTGQQLTVFTASLTLAASLMLKIGTAFGFVAASNTK